MNSWAAHLVSRTPKADILGAELDPFPFISGFGIAWRVARLSCLERKEFFTALGINKLVGLNFLQACHQPGVTRTRFTEHCGLGNTDIPSYWDIQTWSPLDLHGCWRTVDLPMRHCQECARFGYHCTLFLLPSITHCPWHHLPLRSTCCRCGRPYLPCLPPHLANPELGQCECGHDLFNADKAATSMWTFPYQAADALLREYLDWARNARAHRHFVMPPDSRIGILGFTQLAAPPMRWNRSKLQNDFTILKSYQRDGDDSACSAFSAWGMWVARQTHAVASLPCHVYPRLRAVSEVFSKSLDQEQRFIVPFTSSCTHTVWLDISSIDPKATYACNRLLCAVCEHLCNLKCYEHGSLSDWRLTDTLNRLRGRFRLDRALADVIVRGLVQGLEAFFYREFMRPRQLSRWLSPVAEIEGEEGHLRNIRICWVPEPPRDAQPCVNSRG